jgi:hypothetical protein
MKNLISKIKNLFTKNDQVTETDEYHIMSDEEFIQFHNDRLNELEDWIVERAVKVLSEELESLMEETRKLHKEDPIHWMSPFHFYEGMSIRNLLRDKVCLDDQLTTVEKHQNWDNFYVALMEIAAGCREYPNNKSKGE